ncbi:MAG: hypothetical protein ONB05_06545 [candidate division KSB1 bacterium]|nr:hypothetical protein [candidate division KSB1 bacterium]
MRAGSLHESIVNFMEKYFNAFSRYAQIPETQSVMDQFYVPELVNDDGFMPSREQWYRACLSHPTIQNVLVPDHFIVDTRQKEVGALIRTQYTNRATGEILVELKMNVLYGLKIGPKKDIKIKKFRVFVESDPEKLNKMLKLFRK